LQASSRDLEMAAQTAIEALKALGYTGLSMDVALRGVCSDCASGTTETAA
jgi:Fur family ferric uptake transcriptional regulator